MRSSRAGSPREASRLTTETHAPPLAADGGPVHMAYGDSHRVGIAERDDEGSAGRRSS